MSKNRFLVKFIKTFLAYVFTFLLFTVLSGRKLWVVLPKDIEINPLSCDPSCSYQQVCTSLMFLPTGIYVLHLPIKRYVRYPASIPFLREQTCKGTYVVISINPPYLIHNCTIETLIWYIMWKISSFSIGNSDHSYNVFL